MPEHPDPHPGDVAEATVAIRTCPGTDFPDDAIETVLEAVRAGWTLTPPRDREA